MQLSPSSSEGFRGSQSARAGMRSLASKKSVELGFDCNNESDTLMIEELMTVPPVMGKRSAVRSSSISLRPQIDRSPAKPPPTDDERAASGIARNLSKVSTSLLNLVTNPEEENLEFVSRKTQRSCLETMSLIDSLLSSVQGTSCINSPEFR